MKRDKIVRISVGGRDYPCRATMGALLRFKRETGKEVSEIGAGDVSELLTYLWCCVCSACAADGVTFDLSLEEFADLCPMDAFKDWSAALASGSASAEKKTENKA